MAKFFNDIVGFVIIAAVVFSVLKALFSPFIKAMKKQQEEQKRQKPLKPRPQPTFAGDDFGDFRTEEELQPEYLRYEELADTHQPIQVEKELFHEGGHIIPKPAAQKAIPSEPETRTIEVELEDAEDFKKAFIYSEIINRKY